MFGKLKEICEMLKSTNRNRYFFKNISNSVITIISRSSFKVDDIWFNNLLSISYDNEVKSKYIPELHESNTFEKNNLKDILDFKSYIGDITNQLRICEDYIGRFKKSHQDFYQVIDSENTSTTNKQHAFIEQIDTLNNSLYKVEADLVSLKNKFNAASGYQILTIRNQLNSILNPVKNTINYKRDNWENFLDKDPDFSYVINYVFQHHNQVYYELNSLNRILDYFKASSAHKIIIGNAGTGKTHISAHLVNKIKDNGDYVLFFKPKQFNGDNVNLNDRLLQLLQVPPGYTLDEILGRINDLVVKQNKRCFLIIDALNETTNSSIGFSKVWHNHLPDFINQVGLYSHLYIVCTLRTSYVDHIWSIKPSNISELRGFEKTEELQLLCKRYFEYYRIKISNFDTADLNTFRTPLLLDLYCKLINGQRAGEKEIELNMQTYLQTFEEYVENVSKEVQRKLNLQKRKLITAGFSASAERFYRSNEAVLSVDDFSDAFDKDDDITTDNSIARAILEGYLIFIKDIINQKLEVVKHTQQEVGGYLLAKHLSERFSSIEDLLEDNEFKEKVLGADSSKHHQLRLDILKFLISMHPTIIPRLNTTESLSLSWWYLYNGFSHDSGNEIPSYLISLPENSPTVEAILNISSNQWFNTEYEFNFHFVARVLEKLDVWSFDLSWTFFIYKEVDFFYKFIEDNTKRLGEKGLAYDVVVAKFIAFATATTIRELRDLATIYLIEFGKKHPLELIELTEYSTHLADEYIYERLVSCCYGICLIKQNDNQFVESTLPVFADKLYKLQFSENAIHPVYNYVVIDSVKHLIDLAILKGVFNLPELEKDRLDNFQFERPYDWNPPSKEQQALIDKSDERSLPEPIGMDFGIYTIPRLIDENFQRRVAIANVYKRISELGYLSGGFTELQSDQFKRFYSGDRVYITEGKVDRLGKKYAWKSFFDYAGELLLAGKLNVYEKYSEKTYYERLSDVDIDICLPSRNYKKAIRLYQQGLIIERENNPEWYTEIKIDTLTDLFEVHLNDHLHIMLHGMVEQRVDEGYKTRSYLLVESFFVHNSENLEKLKTREAVTFNNWDLDIYRPLDHLSRAYFGELYWADNIGGYETESVSIPTGQKKVSKRFTEVRDIFRLGEYGVEDIGKEIEEEIEERLYFESEPTLVEYLWESESKVLQGYSEYYPSLKMGKSLGLKTDPLTGSILDSNLESCFQCIEFNDQLFKNDFNYMRSDLLRKYMSENNLALVYQIKQHSYDENNDHKRSMKFFILE